jgi:exopolysaccharide biosynthesis polyprenyl glycosylphosphotransferase
MQLFKRNVSPHELILFAMEIVVICAAMIVTIRLHGAAGSWPWQILPAAALCQLCLYYNDVYDLTLVQSGRELLVRLVQAAGAASIILGVLYLAVPSIAVQGLPFVQSLAILLVAIPAGRALFNHVARTPLLVDQVLILGTGQAPREVARELLTRDDPAYHVVGYVDDAPEPRATLGSLPVLGGSPELSALVERHDIRWIVADLRAQRSRALIDALVRAKLNGTRVEDAATAYERLTGKILLEALRPSALLLADGFRVSRGRRAIKRIADLLLSLGMIAVSAPFIALTALAVWLCCGRRAVLYRQERVGQHGRPFTLYKFRSMRLDAEADGPVWARQQDDRVTPIGRVIRLTRLDELPQLWNVLRGDMSFVERLAREIPFYDMRHAVKPGITGWAQVRYRYADSIASANEKLRYDLYYIKHLSAVFDLTIVVDTVKIILFQRGSQ